MWPDTLFISPVPNIRFLFFKVAYYHHYRPSSYYHSFQRSILISICGYWKRRLFFNWPTFVTRCCCQKKLELIFRTLILVSGNFAFQFRNISFALRCFPFSYLAQNYSFRDLDVNKKVFQSRPHKRNSKGIFKRLHLDFFERLECAREE